jgi:cytochrome c biogenesis protein CcdA
VALAGNAALAFGSGVLSTLSPCILPLLPIVLASALGRHRLAPLALAGGVSLSFTGIGLMLASFGFAAGIDGEAVRAAAAILIIAFGAVLLTPRLYDRVGGALSQASGRLASLFGKTSPDGAGGQLVVGLVLGAVWAPCAGPTLGAAIGLAAQGETAAHAGFVMAAFGLGAAAPLVALGYGSRRAIAARREILAGFARIAKPAMGGALVVIGLLVATGYDKAVEAALTQAMPAALVEFTTRL